MTNSEIFITITIMEIDYGKFGKYIENERKGKKEFGKNYDRILARIDLLKAISNLEQCPISKPERRHKLTGNYLGCYAISINEKDRIIIKPIGYDINEEPKNISRIIILEIENYH